MRILNGAVHSAIVFYWSDLVRLLAGLHFPTAPLCRGFHRCRNSGVLEARSDKNTCLARLMGRPRSFGLRYRCTAFNVMMIKLQTRGVKLCTVRRRKRLHVFLRLAPVGLGKNGSVLLCGALNGTDQNTQRALLCDTPNGQIRKEQRRIASQYAERI